MSVTVDWCGHTMIYMNFLDHWDWREFAEGMKRAYTLMSKSTKTINLIVDFVGSVKHVSTSTLTNLVDEVQAPGNYGVIVVVTEDDLLGHKLSRILSQLHPKAQAVVIAKTGEEASALIRGANLVQV